MQPTDIRVGASPSNECVWMTGDLLRIGLGYGTNNDNENVLEQRFRWPSFLANQTYSHRDELNSHMNTSGVLIDRARGAGRITPNSWGTRNLQTERAGPLCANPAAQQMLSPKSTNGELRSTPPTSW